MFVFEKVFCKKGKDCSVYPQQVPSFSNHFPFCPFKNRKPLLYHLKHLRASFSSKDLQQPASSTSLGPRKRFSHLILSNTLHKILSLKTRLETLHHQVSVKLSMRIRMVSKKHGSINHPVPPPEVAKWCVF